MQRYLLRSYLVNCVVNVSCRCAESLLNGASTGNPIQFSGTSVQKSIQKPPELAKGV